MLPHDSKSDLPLIGTFSNMFVNNFLKNIHFQKVMASESMLYHKQCCTCKSCNQKLDSATLCNGADKEIYCQNCHSRKFGGSSFRGSMASTWVNEEAASKMRPCQNIDPTKLKITNDPGKVAKNCQKKAKI